jgi:nicotinamide riboside transporter PnuC
MSKDHERHPHGEQEHHHPKHHSKKRHLHKDWRTWVVVLVMVGLIFAYLASSDETKSPVKDGPAQIMAPAP